MPHEMVWQDNTIYLIHSIKCSSLYKLHIVFVGQSNREVICPPDKKSLFVFEHFALNFAFNIINNNNNFNIISVVL